MRSSFRNWKSQKQETEQFEVLDHCEWPRGSADNRVLARRGNREHEAQGPMAKKQLNKREEKK